MSADEKVTPIPDTSKQSGQLHVAAGISDECRRVADQLEARARSLAVVAGRPDLALPRIARRLRDVARRVDTWRGERTAPTDRDRDRSDAATWLEEARAALEAHPAPIET